MEYAMRHPLEFISPEKRKPLFILFLALTLLLFAVFRVLDEPLRTPAAPNGIVSLELARSPGASVDMVNSWSEHARLLAAFGLGMDYLFMPLYALALSLGILLASRRHTGGFARLGAWMGWAALAAPLFDAVENYGLLHSLLSPLFSLWPLIASVCAAIKFTLLLLGLLYALIGWLWLKRM
ncbi:MAG: hypothetical protein HFACDABA_01756 [Anaerolineales bacterium]|nr:hypothetical protein [Anaerolineales bacterium]